MDKNKISKIAYKTAIEHGFTFGNDSKMLNKIVGELHEALEHDERGGSGWARNVSMVNWMVKQDSVSYDDYTVYVKPTVEAELTDFILRGLSYMAHCEYEFKDDMVMVNLIEVNSNKCKTLDDIVLYCSVYTAQARENLQYLHGAICAMELWCELNGIDLGWHIAAKLDYNKQRPYLHGKTNEA